MEKKFISNRKEQRIALILDQATPQKGLVFIAHGHGSSKDSSRVQLIAGAFSKKGFTTIRFDTTNTFGESDGTYEESTFTNYYEDLEDVIEWAQTQPWFQEPFALAGRSFGGKTATLYAERYSERVLALVAIATGISGTLRIEANNRRDPDRIQKWKQTGWTTKSSPLVPDRLYRLPWSHMEDDLRYDTLKDASKLTMPVLLVVGDKDITTPADHVRQLYEAIPEGKKRLRVIAEMDHTTSEEFFPIVEQALLEWLGELNI